METARNDTVRTARHGTSVGVALVTNTNDRVTIKTNIPDIITIGDPSRTNVRVVCSLARVLSSSLDIPHVVDVLIISEPEITKLVQTLGEVLTELP